MIDLRKKFLIYGYGITGKSIENYLKNKDCNYNIYDDFKKLNKEKFVNKNYILNNIKHYDYFIVSPSIKIGKNHFLYKYKNKILIDLDFLSLEISSQKVIGVTGTEGKSSTCSYLNELLSTKYRTKIIGNFGYTILNKKDLQNFLSKIDILIIELSSYQLDKLKYLKLNYALITNIFYDHLEYHKNFKNYVLSKFRIQNLLYSDSRLYISKKLFLEFGHYIKISRRRLILHDYKSYNKNNLIRYFRELNLNSLKKLIHSIDPSIKIKKNVIMSELNFRNQLIHKSKYLSIYNDSKCTNLSNAVYKINLIKSSKKILILGGKLKTLDHSKFTISNTLVLIFGHYSDSFLARLNFYNSRFYKFTELNELVNFLKLVTNIYKYNYILFSPGGESFDTYQNYSDRGKKFNRLIKKIIF